MKVPQSLGDLQRIHIGHDNSGFGSAWFLDKVVIEDEHTGKQYTFFGQRWLDKSKGAIECDLEEGRIEEDAAKHDKHVKITTPESNITVLASVSASKSPEPHHHEKNKSPEPQHHEKAKSPERHHHEHHETTKSPESDHEKVKSPHHEHLEKAESPKPPHLGQGKSPEPHHEKETSFEPIRSPIATTSHVEEPTPRSPTPKPGSKLLKSKVDFK
jgi:hypothetical protein